MKIPALGVLLSVVLACVGSFCVYTIIQHDRAVRQVAVYPLRVDTDFKSPLITVSPERLTQLGFEVQVESKNVIVKKENSNTSRTLGFELPVTLSVYSDDGTLVQREENRVISGEQGAKFQRESQITSSGGWMRFQTYLEKFKAPSAGRIQIEASVSNNPSFDAKVDDLKLIVTDNVFRHTRYIVGAALAFVLAGISLLLAVVFLIIRASEQTINSAAANNANAGTRSWLAALLLSIFAGAFGVDRFYLGYRGLGLLKLVTFGCCGAWALVDMVLIATGALRDAEGKTLLR